MALRGGGWEETGLGDGNIASGICLNGSFSVIFGGVKGCNSLAGCVWLFRLSSGCKTEGAGDAEAGGTEAGDTEAGGAEASETARGAGVVGAFIDFSCLTGGGDGSRTEEIATAAACRSGCFSIGFSGIAVGGGIFIFVCVSCGAGLSVQIRPAITANADKFKMMLGCGFFITPRTRLFPEKQVVAAG